MSSTTTPALAENPFIAHRRYLDVYHRAVQLGLADEQYVALVSAADERVASVEGTGFRTTPLVSLQTGTEHEPPAPGGPILAKVETANVGGSHKARHLFGLLLHLMLDGLDGQSALPPSSGEVVDALLSSRADDAPLAIASCGNAALGAAVVAASAARRLRVFVPTDADPLVLRRLGELGAEIEICHRRPGEEGDPCITGMNEAVAGGAEAFTVQGPVCPAVIDGGRTLGLELAEQLDDAGVAPAEIYVQIGGGALATAVLDGLALRWPDRELPRLHPVQAVNAHPYAAGWHRLAPVLLSKLGVDDPGTDAARAAVLKANLSRLPLPDALVASEELMTPWPKVPHSVASGILDDLTYDWVTLMAHQIRTGGWPILVEEETFVRARSLVADVVAPPPDETGSAGLAGLLQHRAEPGDHAGPSVVLLTGVVRS